MAERQVVSTAASSYVEAEERRHTCSVAKVYFVVAGRSVWSMPLGEHYAGEVVMAKAVEILKM